ncbi:MAG: bis(5'-nucleosyl)-tetraphosphatase (symmetrical) YqeK [Oscillospiraceae bacterium]
MTVKQAKKLAKSTLSAKRYHHVSNVEKAAVKLAQRYGANVDKAALAAWLHDIVKEAPKERLLQLMGQDAIMAEVFRHQPMPLWHGPCAAIYAKQELGVNDEEVLSAVACHTTGKPNMSLLDKIVYLADMISKERYYDGVEDLRKLAKQDINTAVIAAMQQSIFFIKQSGKPLDEMTVAALKDLQTQSEGKVRGNPVEQRQ